jgi:phosphoglycolate phosphatase
MSAGSRIDLLCFDLDGVLADSTAVIAGCLDAVLADHGVAAITDDELRWFVGPPLEEGLARLLPLRGLDATEAQRWATAYRGHYAVALQDTPLQPGIAAMLDDLAEVGVPLCVVTSKAQVYAGPVVEAMGIGGHFTRVDGPEAGAPEPKAVTLARALRAAGVRGPQAAMIGDRFHDVEAALANDAVAIGVTWGVGDRAELHDAGADTVVDHPRQLVELVQTWNDRVA